MKDFTFESATFRFILTKMEDINILEFSKYTLDEFKNFLLSGNISGYNLLAHDVLDLYNTLNESNYIEIRDLLYHACLSDPSIEICKKIEKFIILNKK